MNMLWNIGQVFLIVAAAPLLSGIIKNWKAHLQNRRGPGVAQVYFDLFKLLAKESVVSPTVSWIFKGAPYIYFATSIAAAAILPVVYYTQTTYSDVLALIYILALGRFFLVLASLDAGSSFGGMGGSREMFIAVLVEPALLLSMLTVAFKAGTTGLWKMVETAAASPFALPYLFSAIAFFIVVIAETGRIPVDNPDTHLELTMIHEGMVLEYAGRKLGLIFWASAIKQLVVVLLFILLFFPWSPSQLPLVSGSWLLLKIIVTAFSIALVETNTNKMRLFKVPGFLAASCLLSMLALIAQ